MDFLNVDKSIWNQNQSISDESVIFDVILRIGLELIKLWNKP